MVNDVSIAASIIFTFILIGGILPYISEEFGGQTIDQNSGNFINTIGNEVKDPDTISAWDVLISMFKMFFWTFGDLPFWIDLIFFIPVRVLLLIILARNLWIGGGG